MGNKKSNGSDRYSFVNSEYKLHVGGIPIKKQVGRCVECGKFTPVPKHVLDEAEEYRNGARVAPYNGRNPFVTVIRYIATCNNCAIENVSNYLNNITDARTKTT